MTAAGCLMAAGAVLAGLLGLLLGTLVAAVAARLPLARPLPAPPACVRTGRPIPLLDALPVAGYFRRRGRCRQCGLRLARWWPLTEAAMGILALLAYAGAGGLNGRFAIYAVTCAALLLIFVMDWRRHEIYLVVLAVTALTGVAGALLLPERSLVDALLGAVGGGLFMLLMYGAARLAYRRGNRVGLAWGDVELGVVLGLVTGAYILNTIVFGMLAGLALLIFMRGRLHQGLQSYFPFAPGLCVVAMMLVLGSTGQGVTFDTVRLPALRAALQFAGYLAVRLVHF